MNRTITGEHIYRNILNLKQLVFEVTDYCNLQCKYCGYGELYEGNDSRNKSVLTFDKAKVMIEFLFNLWNEDKRTSQAPVSVTFYGGEPLLNMNLIENIVQYTENHPLEKKKFFFGMTTNGILLHKHIDYLVEKEFRLLISIDGDEYAHSYRELHDGTNSFNKVVSNINLIRNKYPNYYKKFVQFNAVLHNRNSVEDIYRYLNDNFEKKPRIAPLNTSGIKKEKILDFFNMYNNFEHSVKAASNCETLEKELFTKDLKTKYLAKHIHKNSGNVYNSYSDLLFKKKQNPDSIKTGTCIPFNRKIYLTVNGKILPCEKIDHDFDFGCIEEGKLNLDLDKAAEKYNQITGKVHKQCEVCGRKQNCSQCVFFLNTIRDEQPVCNGFCTESEWEEELNDVMNLLRKQPELYQKIINNLVLR